jgi:hypothetical protein
MEGGSGPPTVIGVFLADVGVPVCPRMYLLAALVAPHVDMDAIAVASFRWAPTAAK